jgi:hypothetical protein
LWANFRALIVIFSQSVGPRLTSWANPVQVSLSGSAWPSCRSAWGSVAFSMVKRGLATFFAILNSGPNRRRHERPGSHRARSRCRFVLLLLYFNNPDLLTYSVPLYLKRQCDRTLDLPDRDPAGGRPALRPHARPGAPQTGGSRGFVLPPEFLLTSFHTVCVVQFGGHLPSLPSF